MKSNYSISIPKPCHEDWAKMTPHKKGRFCQLCSKTVIDFTTMSKKQVEEYLAIHSKNKICGRFKVSQLEEIRIKIPQQLIKQQTNFNKLFLLALLIAMGTTLFNCSDQNGNTKRIDVVEVVDSLKIKSEDIGKIKTDTAKPLEDHLKQIPNKPHKVPVPILTGDVVIDTILKNEPIKLDNVEHSEQILNEEIVVGFMVISHPPEFKGMPKNLSISEKKTYMTNEINKIISDNFNKDIGRSLSLKGKQRIMVQFKINEDGRVTNIKARGTHPELEKEAKRVINLLPQFIPGLQSGKNIGVVYSLPIVFIVEDS
ncbi:energy transducer TonB [Winogradskyella eckloniae]|uniref:energy transducer TonB n=1 Tax=Winogradskyella eckloniae TaxID=1089306 RepID=UPI001563F365|nr:energy transducer TonB [Winogradskyella eckloniae]NRD18900.1 energy transducer TonB [Winogradskyella eckloniae]